MIIHVKIIILCSIKKLDYTNNSYQNQFLKTNRTFTEKRMYYVKLVLKVRINKRFNKRRARYKSFRVFHVYNTSEMFSFFYKKLQMIKKE